MKVLHNFIAGEWVDADNGGRRQRHNPADDAEVVNDAPDSTAVDASRAVAAVAEGYHEWAERTPQDRAEVLNHAADILAQRSDQLAHDLVREEGKTLAEALGETRRTPANLRMYAAEGLRLFGQVFPTGNGPLVFTHRQPVGVVAVITPWNFPLNIPSRKIGPALAAGNGVVFKPSELTPGTADALVRALLEAGLPGGAIALVQGGGEVGAALVADQRVAAITFTGSSAVGSAIHGATTAQQRCQLEMGGKNPVVVLADADVDRAASLITRGGFGLTGQACTGTSRILVEDRVHDALAERLAAAAKARVVGSGLTEGTQMGPLVSHPQYTKVMGHVDRAVRTGASLIAGDEALDGCCARGQFVRPVVLTGVRPEDPIAQEEVFGPVLAMMRVESYEDAVAVANNTRYGLSASIITNDMHRALDFVHRIDSGVVKVNLPTTGVAMNAPFGGMKDSSTQTYKEQAGELMMHFYTTDKTVYVSS